MEREPVPMIVTIECPEHGLLGTIDGRLAKGIIEKHILTEGCEVIEVRMAGEQLDGFDFQISPWTPPRDVREN